jgi:hypothetical protein
VCGAVLICFPGFSEDFLRGVKNKLKGARGALQHTPTYIHTLAAYFGAPGLLKLCKIGAFKVYVCMFCTLYKSETDFFVLAALAEELPGVCRDPRKSAMYIHTPRRLILSEFELVIGKIED